MTNLIFKEVDSLQMGVMPDGVPFLSQRSLAQLCGVTPRAIRDWGQIPPTQDSSLRFQKLYSLLIEQGFTGALLYEIIIIGNTEVYAYSDSVCMAFLEYYAFEADNDFREARNNYRALARKTLKDFIYRLVGFDPGNIVPQTWRYFHDRMILNTIPVDYFSVFKETADIVIASIREGLIVDDHTVPDISVGQMWSKYWVAHDFDKQYGQRIRYSHQYPDYFPQSKANSDINPYVYPIKSLGEFRKWLYADYLPNKFPNYLKRKVKLGAIPATSAELLLKAVIPDQLE